MVLSQLRTSAALAILPMILSLTPSIEGMGRCERKRFAGFSRNRNWRVGEESKSDIGRPAIRPIVDEIRIQRILLDGVRIDEAITVA
jgi:hypothetical protein